MKIFLNLFLVVFLVDKIVSTRIKLGENDHFAFFSEQLIFHNPEEPAAADIHGKFISDSRQVSMAKSFDLPLLQECSELNHSLVEFDHDVQKKKKRIQRFVKSLNNSFKGTRDRAKLKTTLLHFHCIHALKSVDFEEIDVNLIIKLIKEFPEVMKLHLDVLGNLNDFSFLTVELAKVLFMDKNEYLRPFGLDSLIETVSKEVLIELIKMWNFDLRIEDAQTVLSIREDDLLEISEVDPRAWLIWRKAQAPKPFPLDLLLEKISLESFDVYVNLILAFIYHRESAVFNSMYALEYLYADIHKNDPIEEKFMTEEMVAALESRKWDIWYEFGKAHIAVIDAQMKMSSKLIEKLKEFMAIQEEANADIPSRLIILNVSVLLQVPLNLHARTTFMKSRNIDQLIEAQESYVYYHPFEYTPIVLAANIFNPVYWQVLWVQLEVLDVKLVYDAALCENYSDFKELMGSILSLSRFALKNNGAKSFPNYYWHLNLNTLLLSHEVRDNLSSSQAFIGTMLVYMRDQVCELDPFQLSFIRSYLHQDIDEDDFAMLAVRDVSFDAFRLAPELLKREEIEYLVQSPDLKKLMKYSTENVKKLRFLGSFTADDLKEFFPVGGNYHLDSFEALYTADPEALKEYLFCSQAAVNYPDNLIWWLHPRAWDNLALVDVIAEIVPFSVFLKHPKDAEDLNLVSIFTDIVSRIKRNPDQAPQKLILKWVMHMEWFFFQFYNYFYIDASPTKITALVYERILGFEKKARAKLITWLKENETLEDGQVLLELVEKSPLSYLRTTFAYDNLLNDSFLKLNREPRQQNLRDNYTQFAVFTSVSSVYKIRESDLVATVSQAIANCESLGEKYFDLIEKQIWMNRVKMFSFTTFSKYHLNPIPGKFADRLFRNHGAPLHDVFTFFYLLSRSGHHENAVKRVFENDHVKQNPSVFEVCKAKAQRYESVILSVRRLLLEHEMKNMKKDDKKK